MGTDRIPLYLVVAVISNNREGVGAIEEDSDIAYIALEAILNHRI